MEEEREEDRIASFLGEGYTVAVKNPYAVAFNMKYSVYKESEKFGRKYIFTDKDGNPRSAQG